MRLLREFSSMVLLGRLVVQLQLYREFPSPPTSSDS